MSGCVSGSLLEIAGTITVSVATRASVVDLDSAVPVVKSICDRLDSEGAFSCVSSLVVDFAT